MGISAEATSGHAQGAHWNVCWAILGQLGVIHQFDTPVAHQSSQGSYPDIFTLQSPGCTRRPRHASASRSCAGCHQFNAHAGALPTTFSCHSERQSSGDDLARTGADHRGIPESSSVLRSFRSTHQQSGALMSSRLMPPKVGSMEAMLSTSRIEIHAFSLISISNTAIPANFLNRTPLAPRMTGWN
jgi:hypothetical protein